jgi:Voltage-dependent anion channel
MLYILFIALILYRWMFLSMQPEKLAPPYWINMGALAITTLAECRLLLVSNHWPFLEAMGPFIRGFTFFFWVTGTWWIPLLLCVGFWRHVIEKVPIAYDLQYWSLGVPNRNVHRLHVYAQQGFSPTLYYADPKYYPLPCLCRLDTDFCGNGKTFIRGNISGIRCPDSKKGTA